jgi:hypothetical protein
MSTTVTSEAPVASNLEDALETGFLPDDPHYRLTGEFKDEKPEKKEEVEAPATPGDKGDEIAAASEAAPPQEETPAQTRTTRTSESRWQKITRENKDLKERLLKLETSQPKRDPQQTSQPAPEKAKANAEPMVDDVDPKTGKPVYADWREWQKAHDKWNRSEAVREFQEISAKTAAEQQRTQAERTVAEGFAKKLEPVREKYQDFVSVALNPDLVIPRGSATDIFLLDSEHAGEVLYYLGQHPEILQGFYGEHDPKAGRFVNKINPAQQFRKLAQIEGTFSGTQTPPAKPVTQAARPPHQVSGKGTVAKDAVDQAVEDGDFETYQKAQNAKDLARLKRK